MLAVRFLFPDFDVLQKENAEIQFLQGLLLEIGSHEVLEGEPGDYKDV